MYSPHLAPSDFVEKFETSSEASDDEEDWTERENDDVVPAPTKEVDDCQD
jgi:hypothetical protein